MFSLDNIIQAGVYWTSEVNKMDQELKELLLSMQSEIRSIHTEMSEMKQTQQQQGQEIAKINMTLEHDVSKQLELLGEGQHMVIEKFTKLDQVAEDVEEIKIKVSALEEVSRSQASQIREIRLAK